MYNKQLALWVGMFLAIIFSAFILACPNPNSGTTGGGNATVTFIKVAYSDLATHLSNTASATETNYIEVTGLGAADLKGNTPAPSPLGALLKAAPTKKVSLKLPSSVAGLTDMTDAFLGCTSLVEVASIPNSVTDMDSCFSGCTALRVAPPIPNLVKDMRNCFNNCKTLSEAPTIPNSVTNMLGCFNGCTALVTVPNISTSVTTMSGCFVDCSSLTTVPAIPSTVTAMDSCFAKCTALVTAPAIPSSVTLMKYCFQNCSKLTGVTLSCNYGTDDSFKNAFASCTALTNGSIKVPTGQFQTYKDNAANMGTAAEKFSAQ